MDGSLIRRSNPGIMDDFDGESFSSSEDGESSSSAGSEDGSSSSSSFEMSSLIAQLPFRRGLSKHFEGKSQSFTCLSNVRKLEDLAKPVKQRCKKLKQCKSYGGGLDGHKTITKKASRGSFSSLGPRRPSFNLNRPPVSPQRSRSHALLFA